jgi:hypothetical protein
MITLKKLSLAVVLLVGLSTQTFAQTPDWRINSGFKYVEKGEGKKVVIASVNIKTAVSLERLSLFSGEGNTDKKIFSGLLAGAASLAGLKGDFASREPIEEHLKQEDAEKIATDTFTLLMERLKTSGLDVQGPKAIVDAPAYAAVKGEEKTIKVVESEEGRLFKKGYFYGVYQTPVAGMKYRDVSGFALMNTDLYSSALQLTNTSGALNINLGFVNDKSTFSVANFVVNVYALSKGGTKPAASFTIELKNLSEFSVPSGGKDTNAYWTALKPKLEILFDDVGKRIVAAYGEE